MSVYGADSVNVEEIGLDLFVNFVDQFYNILNFLKLLVILLGLCLVIRDNKNLATKVVDQWLLAARFDT